MKVVLVMPPNPILDTPTMYPNLGVLYIAAMLEQAGHKVQIADLRDKKASIDLIPEAPIIGFSATTGEIEDAKKLAKLAKRRDPKCTTVIGGAHASLLPGDCSEHFDQVVVGEGELVFAAMPKEFWRMFSKTVHADRITDLDSLPFPARHLANSFSETLIPGEKYGHGEKATTVIFSRGCIWGRCAYCANILHNPVVYRSPENIRNEVRELISKYDCRSFRVEDDNFTANSEWLVAVCEKLAPLKVTFKAHSRGNLFTEDSIEALKDAGCIEMGMGLESADQRVLDKVHKGIRVGDCGRAVQLLKKHGVTSKVYFVTHLPAETSETIELNQEFMKTYRPDKWTCSRFAPYPGSPIWRDPGAFGITWLDPDYSHYWNFYPSALVEYQETSREELDKRYKEFHRWLTENCLNSK